MTLFQVLLIAAVIAAAALAIKFLPGERSLALKRIIALLFVIAAIVAIVFPGVLTAVANFFGIGRGTDLLLYLFIVAVLIFAVMVVRAKARSDARVTDLARAVALMEARLTAEKSAAGSAPTPPVTPSSQVNPASPASPASPSSSDEDTK